MSILETLQNQDLNLTEIIGTGSYGQVYKALHLTTQKFVAVKYIFRASYDLKKHLPELLAMKRCKSQYIISYYGSEWKNEDLYVCE